MLDVALILAAAGCWICVSGLALLPRLDGRWSRWLGLLGVTFASIGAVHGLLSGVSSQFEFPFWRGAARLEVDALSAAFLLPLHLVAGLGLLYGKEYSNLK